MSKVSVFNPAWIDLVFEGRNQSYGAYQLRRDDSKTTSIALLSGIGLMVALAGAPAIVNYFTGDVTPIALNDKESGTIIKVDNGTIFKVDPPKPIVEKATPPAAAAPSALPTIKHTAFVATSQPVPNPPTTEQVLAANPSTATTEGTAGGNITSNAPTGVIDGPGTSPTPEVSNGIETTVSVDVMPTYPGGMQKFYEEVGRKFRTPINIEDAATLKVYVSFVIEKDGSMTNIKVLRDPGHDMGKEALRVLQSIKTKWTAGKKAGQPVRTAYNLPITINVN
jgi:protein TonB